MYQSQKKPICIIPARSGSERIKNKNIILFFGKPIIYYSIKVALESKLFSKVIVSTNSLKIAKISKSYGAEVPFLRSKKLADKYTSTYEVMVDAIKKINSNKTKYHFCLYATSPMIKISDLKNSFDKIKKLDFDALVAVGAYNFSPFRAFKLKKNNTIEFLNKKFLLKRSQDLKTTYHDTGTFCIFKTDYILKNPKPNLPKKTTFYRIDKYRVVDINNYDDVKYAKFLYRFMNN